MPTSIEIVGGTWREQDRRKSKTFDNIIEGVKSTNLFNTVDAWNGGYFRFLYKVIIPKLGARRVIGYPKNVVIWMPNISNNLPKKKSIKKILPHTILVTSKRNTDGKYSLQDVIAHGLNLKSNLVLEIVTMNDGKYGGRLLDTLGNVWCDSTSNFKEIGIAIANRSRELMDITRQGTVQSPEKQDQFYDSQNKFFDIVKDCAEKFHDLIHPAKDITRFLGNASFRCEKGFPSMRLLNGNIYVSRRNVDKRFIGPDTFVQVGLNRDTDTVWYRGENKPSVDTVIQVRLYDKLPDINYMVHSHVYVKGAPFTSRMIPCGGLEEVDEIMAIVAVNGLYLKWSFAINLLGHGSIIFTKHTMHPSDGFEFVARPIPEDLSY